MWHTYWTLSWGFGFLRPLCTCAGSSRLCSHMELAPLHAKVWTIWKQKSKSRLRQRHHESRWLLLLVPVSSRDGLQLICPLTWSSVGGHPLCLKCFTMEIWRPRLRWTEQHSSQIRTPRLMLAQPGSGGQKAKKINGMRGTELTLCQKHAYALKFNPDLLLNAFSTICPTTKTNWCINTCVHTHTQTPKLNVKRSSSKSMNWLDV